MLRDKSFRKHRQINFVTSQMGYEKGNFVTEAAAPIDVYHGIRYAMWKLRRNMWGRLKKKQIG